jgi:putative tryptophan/tyrosine transport system substrate-binding protein
MRRRKFISLLGGGAVAWPFRARAQQAVPVVGFLNSGSPENVFFANLANAFREGLSDTGYVDGRNVTIDYHWAQGQYDRLPVMAADLVRRQVAVISAGGPPAAMAAKAATATIPIVFTVGDDPVKLGLVASFSRPGGNATGVNVITDELETKRLGLLHELVPAATIAVLLNPNRPAIDVKSRDVQAAARAIGTQIHLLNASSESEIDAAFATLLQLGAGGLLVGSDPFFTVRGEQLVALAARHAIPSIYDDRDFAAAGGLISYGISFPGMYRQAGNYVGRGFGCQPLTDGATHSRAGVRTPARDETGGSGTGSCSGLYGGLSAVGAVREGSQRDRVH